MDWGSSVREAIAAFLVGGGLTGVGAWILNKIKIDGEELRKNTAQPVEHYAKMVDDLRAELARQAQFVETLRANEERNRKEHEAIQDALHREHAQCRYELGKLYGIIDELRQQVNYDREQGFVHRQNAIKVAAELAAGESQKAVAAAENSMRTVADVAVGLVHAAAALPAISVEGSASIGSPPVAAFPARPTAGQR